MKYPHLNTDNVFPAANGSETASAIDVFKYDNDFDYSRFDKTQMDLTICNVPWDMGEAHVGQRTLSGIGHVVDFGSEEARNAYFSSIPDSECYRFATKYKELHRDNEIIVEIPFDIASNLNYLWVHYHLFANDDSPVKFEKQGGFQDWFWFIREAEFLAPNATKLHLAIDAWQTFIYRFDISEMMLERGHAPMKLVTADEFLSNPIQKSDYLLCEDINYSEARISTHTSEFVFNDGDMYAVIATSGDVLSDWGTPDDDWKTSADVVYTPQGVVGYRYIAVEAAQLSNFFNSVLENVPQFFQTVKGVYFASEKIIDLGSEFEFAGFPCRNVTANPKQYELHNLAKEDFAYPARYADIAKLYTFPYAYLYVTDEDGEGVIVHVEDTDGTLMLETSFNMSLPWVNIDAHLSGIGKGARRSVKFKSMTERGFLIQGNWFEFVKKHKIPVYGVRIQAIDDYMFKTYYERKQKQLEADVAKANADASAEAAYLNAKASATTARTNADENALVARQDAEETSETQYGQQGNVYRSANATWSNATASSETEKNNQYRNADLIVDNADLQADFNDAQHQATENINELMYIGTVANTSAKTAAGNALATNMTNNEIEAKERSTTVSNAQGMLGGAASGAVSGAAMGPIGAVAGGIGGLIGGAVNAAFADAQTAIANNLSSTQTAAQNSFNSSMQSLTNTWNSILKNQSTAQSRSNKDNSNDLATGTAANSAATAKANASATDATNDANADRDWDATTANADATNANNYSVAERDYDQAIENNERTEATAHANAQRTYDAARANSTRDKSTREAAIRAGIDSARLLEPLEYGEWSNGESAPTRPVMIASNVITQPADAIARAGDEMLRFGYMVNRRWEFDGEWCQMKHFTYWKLSDFWVRDLSIPDLYADKLRFFLLGGVTVWRDPAKIGKVSIYDN